MSFQHENRQNLDALVRHCWHFNMKLSVPDEMSVKNTCIAPQVIIIS